MMITSPSLVYKVIPLVMLLLMACTQTEVKQSVPPLANPNALDLVLPASKASIKVDTIYINNDSMVWKGEALDLKRLELKIQALKKEEQIQEITIAPKKNTKIERIVALLEIAQRNDIELILNEY